MTAQPFFSIVIPTKNRPALLRDAIRSVLLQDFDDYELIVSDNFNDEKTRQVIESVLSNPRLRYLRTAAELPMPSHWEFATTKAHGRYVLVLTDRSVLKQQSLKRIHRAILSQKEEIAVCSWRWSLFDDSKGILFGDAGRANRGDVAVLNSESIVRTFVNQSEYYPYALPRGLNSCYRQELATKIRGKLGELFLPVNPDFTSAFLLLAHTAQVIHINDALFISRGLTISNGAKGVASTSWPYLETLEGKNFFDHVPVKAAIVENLIFNDFLTVQDLARGNLDGIPINWVEYFVACYRELLEKKGARLIGDAALAEMFAEWETALAGFDPATQYAVRIKISRLGSLKIKMLLKRSPVGPFLLGLKRYVDAPGPVGFKTRYKNALSVAGFRAPAQ